MTKKKPRFGAIPKLHMLRKSHETPKPTPKPTPRPSRTVVREVEELPRFCYGTFMKLWLFFGVRTHNWRHDLINGLLWSHKHRHIMLILVTFSVIGSWLRSVQHWIDRSLELWILGSVDRWSVGSVDRWSLGSVDRWSVGSVDRWILGSVDRWSIGSVDRWSGWLL